MKGLAGYAAFDFITQKDWQESKFSQALFRDRALISNFWSNYLDLLKTGYDFSPKQLEMVVSITGCFRLCQRHLEIHKEWHKSNYTDFHKSNEETCFHHVADVRRCTIKEPFRSQGEYGPLNREDSFLSTDYRTNIGKFFPWTIRWEVF